jgi:hypothetical protein
MTLEVLRVWCGGNPLQWGWRAFKSRRAPMFRMSKPLRFNGSDSRPESALAMHDVVASTLRLGALIVGKSGGAAALASRSVVPTAHRRAHGMMGVMRVGLGSRSFQFTRKSYL